MISKSKLQNAKQKLSKLKEKYFNSSNFAKDDADITDFLPNNDLSDNKLEKDQSTFDNTVLAVHQIKSPRIEITNLFDDAEHNNDEKISSSVLGNNYNLVDKQHHSNFSSPHSPSDRSYGSKVTNKTLKTESIVLSDLSNQFEHICFLPSSSDEENTIGLNRASFPQSSRRLDSSFDLHLSPIQSFHQNSETKLNNVQKRAVSSSEMSEIESNVDSTVFSDKEESVKICLQPVKLDVDNPKEGIFEKKEIEEIDTYSEHSESCYKTMSNEKQTSISDLHLQLHSSIQTQDNYSTEPSEKFKPISLLKEKKQSQPSKTTLIKQKRKNHKTSEISNVLNLKLRSKPKNYDNNKRTFENGEVSTSDRYIHQSPVAYNNRTVHEGVSSLPKQSRRKHPKKSKTNLKHSTNLKPSTERPVLKSCILIGLNESNEGNKLPTQQSTFPSKLDGCGHEEVISQLLWNQVQLTRHFIHSHHQMYLTCCQAVKILSENYNKRHAA